METIEYRGVVDKSDWGDGPWQSEPDKKQWRDAATGLPCLIVRNAHATGALCGYVGVSANHPTYGKNYGDVDVDCHGGLTFSDSCHHSADPSRGICHIPGEGEPDDIWWLGFDCAHGGDVSPLIVQRLAKAGLPPIPWIEQEEYRTFAYVESECAKLAAQLHAQSMGA